MGRMGIASPSVLILSLYDLLPRRTEPHCPPRSRTNKGPPDPNRTPAHPSPSGPAFPGRMVSLNWKKLSNERWRCPATPPKDGSFIFFSRNWPALCWLHYDYKQPHHATNFTLTLTIWTREDRIIVDSGVFSYSDFKKTHKAHLFGGISIGKSKFQCSFKIRHHIIKHNNFIFEHFF